MLPVQSRRTTKALTPWARTVGEVVVAIVARALRAMNTVWSVPLVAARSFRESVARWVKSDVVNSRGGPMQGAAELVGEGVEGETVDRHASSRWCSRTTTSL